MRQGQKAPESASPIVMIEINLKNTRLFGFNTNAFYFCIIVYTIYWIVPFSSSHFELRFHQNLRYAYPFSRSGVKGSRMQVLINTNHLDHLLNVVLFWANR